MKNLSIYHEKILKLASLNKITPEIINFNTSFELKNPMCGDQVLVKILANNNLIMDISAKVRGCALCEASAGMVVKIFKNHYPNADKIFENFTNWLNNEITSSSIKLPKDIEIFLPIRPIQNRHYCVLMPFEATNKAIKNLK